MKAKRIDLAAAVAALPRVNVADWTFRELVETYTARHCTRGDAERLRKWVALLGELPAWSVTTEQLVAGRDAMTAQGYSVGAVNRDLSAIGSAYRFAEDKRMTPRGFVSPTRVIRRQAEPIRRVMLSDAERAAIVAGARANRDPRFALLVALLADTGARKGEILGRRWCEFDTERGEVIVEKTKTGRPRVLFFSPATAALIERLRPRGEAADKLAFAGRRGEPTDYRKAWQALVLDIGRPELRMHDLRHAAAAALLRAGVSTGVAAQVLGHGVDVLTRRYGHLEAAALQAAQRTAWAARQ
jgi:integrase